jgi:hypothetical protein
MAKFFSATVHVCMDEDGGWGCGLGRIDAMQNYQEGHGVPNRLGLRFVACTISIPVPVMIEIAVELSNDDDDAPVTVTVKG